MNKLNQMGKTSFKSLEQISKYISDKINDLNKGQLNNSEIEELTVNAQELYERLIVIRHKSYETFSESTTIIEIEKPTVIEKSIEIPEQSIENMLEEVSPMMSFDFTEPVETLEKNEETSTIQNQIIEESNETESINAEESEESNSLNETISKNTTSLNDSFKPSGSLADKLTNSKINDLKSAIGINEKFAFITDLFEGSNENYNAAINKLNNCENSHDAKQILNEISMANNWDLDNSTVGSFLELIERRH